MGENSRMVGPFWVVYDKIVGDFASIDDVDSGKIVKDKDCFKRNVDRAQSWQAIRSDNSYPKKDENHYQHGEIVFDTVKCKFKVLCTPKLLCDPAFQRRIIRTCGLNRWTIFSSL